VSFWREVFSDNGVPSFSNVGTFVLILAVIGWDTYLVVTKGALPNLTEQALFIPLLYAVKKAAVTVSGFNGRDNQQK